MEKKYRSYNTAKKVSLKKKIEQNTLLKYVYSCENMFIMPLSQLLIQFI